MNSLARAFPLTSSTLLTVFRCFDVKRRGVEAFMEEGYQRVQFVDRERLVLLARYKHIKRDIEDLRNRFRFSKFEGPRPVLDFRDSLLCDRHVHRS